MTCLVRKTSNSIDFDFEAGATYNHHSKRLAVNLNVRATYLEDIPLISGRASLSVLCDQKQGLRVR